MNNMNNNNKLVNTTIKAITVILAIIVGIMGIGVMMTSFFYWNLPSSEVMSAMEVSDSIGLSAILMLGSGFFMIATAYLWVEGTHKSEVYEYTPNTTDTTDTTDTTTDTTTVHSTECECDTCGRIDNRYHNAAECNCSECTVDRKLGYVHFSKKN